MSLTGSASMTNELQGSVESGGEVRGKLSGLEFIQGKSAYEVAVINGFSGTEEEWLASLKGEPGRPGAKGEQGEPGTVVFEELTDEQKEMLRGYPGKDGEDGKDGYTPVKGVDYFDGKDGKDGSPGVDGVNGVSPTVSVSTISGGHRVSITDANGTKTFDVMDGEDGAAGAGTGDMLAKVYDPTGKKQDIFAYVDEKTKDIDVDVTADEVTFADGETFQQKYDSGELTGPAGKDGQPGSAGKDGSPGADGQPGADGEDGYSPTVSVVTITGGHRITITDKNGTETVDVMDGSDGSPGSNGQPGADGYTPVKGTDYWTAADKQEIIEDLKDEGIGGGIATITAASTDGVAYTAELDGLTAYTDGLMVAVVTSVDSTGNSTLNINNLGAVPVGSLGLGVHTSGSWVFNEDVLTLRGSLLPAVLMYRGGYWVHMGFTRVSINGITGTFGGVVKAQMQAPGTSLLRNSKLLDATTYDAVTDWSTHLCNGEIAWRYE